MPDSPSYREWYLGDGLISDRHPGLERDGHPLTGLTWLAVINPGDEPAAARLTVYHREAPPVAHDLVAPGGRSTLWELHRLQPALPRDEPFGLRLETDQPVIPQATQMEFRAFERLPEATAGRALHPGPLTGQTQWWFCDGWMGGATGQGAWYERETLYVLNPGQDEARVELTVYSEREAATTQYWVDPQRLHTLPLWDLPGFRWRLTSRRARMPGNFSLRLRASVPVVAQKTRRAYQRFDPTVQGMWTAFGCPAALEDG
jgi:hypothetical protein